MIGMPNASVLPVPVRAWPIRSVPIRATERVISWMAKGVVMPPRSSASQISGCTPSSRKVVTICRFRLVSVHSRCGGPVESKDDGTSTAHMLGGGSRRKSFVDSVYR